MIRRMVWIYGYIKNLVCQRLEYGEKRRQYTRKPLLDIIQYILFSNNVGNWLFSFLCIPISIYILKSFKDVDNDQIEDILFSINVGNWFFSFLCIPLSIYIHQSFKDVDNDQTEFIQLYQWHKLYK